MYIINDIVDIEKDLHHPQKKFRPIALGTVSIRTALVVSFILTAISLSISFLISRPLFYTEIFYIILNIFYSFYLKYYALFDVMTIAIGFVLRAIAGVLVINVQISPWLIIGVFLFALVLALGKRQHDLTIAKKSRDCLNQYTEKMIDSMITISVSLLLISYALYSLYVNIYILFTLPFAFYGVFRYIQLIYLNNFGGEGDLILKDRASLINLALWVVSIILILYYPEIVTKIATYISIS